MSRAILGKLATTRRWWMRILAVILVIGLLATAGLAEASRVIFNAATGANAAEQDAAGYLEDNTAYLDEPLRRRMASVVLSSLRKPKTYADYSLRLSLLIAKADYAAAAEACAACIELWQNDEPSLSQLWTKLACLYALCGNYAAARDALNTAISLGGADADPAMYLLRAQMSAQMNDAKAALGDIASYEAQTGDEATLRSIKAPLLEAAGEYAAAEAAYTAMLEGEEPDASAYGGRARVRLLLGDYIGSFADAEAFLSAGQTDADGSVRYILAACAMQQGDYARAEENFVLALEAGYPTPANVYSSLVYARYMQGDLSGAREAGESALALEGGETAELLQWMGIMDMAEGAYAAAADYFRRGIAFNDTQADLHYYLGVCLVAQNKYAAAVEEFTTSIGRGESLANSHYNRGVCYAALLDYQSAYDDMALAIANSQEADLTASATELMKTLAAALGE